MSWNNIPNNERLHLWKKLREDISVLPIEHQMTMVAKFFADMPFGSRTIDYYTPADWPTPWEILFHGTFCTSSISILMFYTFELLHTSHQINLYLVKDNDVYLLPVIDNKFVLNYELGTVNNYSNIQDNFKVLQIFHDEIKMLR